MSETLYASPLLRWPGSIADLDARQALAERTSRRVEDGQLVGIGSGSDAYLTLCAIGRRVRDEHLTVGVVCTSYETQTAALTLGLTLCQLGSAEPDWGVDGADEVDRTNRLLKGRGVAPLKAKLLWRTAQHMYLAMDPPGFVETLGAELPLPVEVHPDGVTPTARELTRLGATDVCLRLSTGKDGPVFTESGNLLLDARFPGLAPGLHAEIMALPGVIETGLFEGFEFETA